MLSARAYAASLRGGMMSHRSWVLLSLSIMALVGCARTAPDISDANVSALLGASTFAGQWRCKTDRLPGTRWYELPATSCAADDSSGTTSTQVHTIIDHDGHVEMASRDWWNRDSSEWVARRDSIARAVVARFPNATRCQGPPAAYVPPPQPEQAGVIRDHRAWRAQKYDVEISTLGSTTSADIHGRPVYVLSLNVATAPGWLMECGSEAQWRTVPRPHLPRMRTDTALRR